MPPSLIAGHNNSNIKINEQLKVQTFAIDISAYTESINVEVDLILPNPDLRFSSIADKVIVKLLIEEVKEEDGSEEIKNPTKKKK